jgi:hypothetical protein
MKKRIKIGDVYIINYSEELHISLTNRYIRIYKGRFDCKYKPLHGKKFTEEISVPKLGSGNFGEPSFKYYLCHPKSAPIFDTMEALIIYYHQSIYANYFPALGKRYNGIRRRTCLTNNKERMKTFNELKAKVTSLVKKVKDYFKAATVKSVLKDVCKAIWKFFHWRFATIVLGGFASFIVYYDSSQLIGLVLLAVFVLMLINYLTSSKVTATTGATI